MESGKKRRRRKKRKVASLKTETLRRSPQVDIAEYLSTPGIPVSAHHALLESLRSMKVYEETLSWRTVVLWRCR